MLNYIWLGMLVIGFVLGIFTGRVDAVTKAAIDSSKTAVELCIGLLGVMCLWCGLMNIAKKSGLVDKLASMVRPIMKLLFPKIPPKHPALGAMVMNLVANFFGLANAATPLGLKAMEELQKLNPTKDTATDSMSMFLVLNTAAIQLVPTTIIALRAAQGSKNPAEIMLPIWVASCIATIVGIITVKIFAASWRNKGRWR